MVEEREKFQRRGKKIEKQGKDKGEVENNVVMQY